MASSNKNSKNRKAANGYRLPDPIPKGEVLSSAANKQSWILGDSIGVGGFGEIYLCQQFKPDEGDKENKQLALKLEPHGNGPLFVEMNFYLRAAQPDSVESFRSQKSSRLSSSTHLGMPVFRGCGSHVYKGEKYRFLVMDRFGKDLQSIFLNGKKLFSVGTSFNLALQIIDVLEYIHSKNYVHNDIKAQNLLLGYGRKSEQNVVYLVDFGLVTKFKRDDVHIECKADARRAHDGTIEYTSRDAHIGTHSRRSDLEILAYNLVHWMSGKLPWLDVLNSPQAVYTKKKNYMNDIPSFLSHCFQDDNYCPDELSQFIHHINQLDFDASPDYDKCRQIFTSGLKRHKLPRDGKVTFNSPCSSSPAPLATGRKGVQNSCKSPVKTPKSRRTVKADASTATPLTSPTGRDRVTCHVKEDDGSVGNSAVKKRRKSERNESTSNSNSVRCSLSFETSSSEVESVDVTTAEKGSISKPCHGQETTTDHFQFDDDNCNPEGAVTRSVDDLDGWCWESVLGSNPEEMLRSANSRCSTTDATLEDDSWGPPGNFATSRNFILAMERREADQRLEVESLRNPTPPMRKLMRRIADREHQRLSMSWREQLAHLTGSSSSRRSSIISSHPNPLTPAMEEVIAIRQSRISMQNDTPITPEPSDNESLASLSDDDSNEGSDDPVFSNDEEDVESQSKTRFTKYTRSSTVELFDKSLLKILSVEGISISEQREALDKYEKAKKKDSSPRYKRKPDTVDDSCDRIIRRLRSATEGLDCTKREDEPIAGPSGRCNTKGRTSSYKKSSVLNVPPISVKSDKRRSLRSSLINTSTVPPSRRVSLDENVVFKVPKVPPLRPVTRSVVRQCNKQ